MKFKTADIQHIADLARLDLTPAELSMYGEQLSAITAYIDQLQEVKTEVVINNTDLHNVWREDTVLDWEDAGKQIALAQGEREGGLLKVKRVL
ncbi:MAG: aspartyl/glutamyl-tRNA amidotransferase subunit C [Patescibacteria group bacterium]|nr:aspartyl/glutamyl-tRNA amidotransferase subunit C [Patescibacteria group bacterium]